MAAGFGPAPTPAAPRAQNGPSRAAAAVLTVLRDHAGPITAAELAARLGQHTNTVREHLDALVEERLATRERSPANGRGRPAWLYAATPSAPASREYAGLATALAVQLARSSAHPREDAVAAGARWGRQLAEAVPDEPATAAAARRQVVRLLDALGFAPSPDERTMTVRLRQCPLLVAARQQPEVVCSVHLGIVRGALATWHTKNGDTGLVPFAQPGACLLHLTGATAHSS
jgi:predicted ArsR family transcriptional regulator